MTGNKTRDGEVVGEMPIEKGIPPVAKMTITQAINELTGLLTHTMLYPQQKALILGLEALDRIWQERRFSEQRPPRVGLLDGEAYDPSEDAL